MAPHVDQATVLILDIGVNVSASDEKHEKSFFEQARLCTARVLERKIMAETKELIGILLLGTKKTKNAMAEEVRGAFRHIELFVELQNPTWKMIQSLPEMPSSSKGDWVDSIVVAADHLKNGLSGYRVSNKKIILMTNFQEPHNYSSKDVDQILNGLKEDNFQVDIIGPDIFMDSHKGDDWELARRFIETTDGATATFSEVSDYLNFHKKRAKNAVAYNVDLSIGPNIKIPVSSYIRIRDEPAVKTWRKAVKDQITGKASTTEGIIKSKQHINTDNQTTVPTEDIIKGFHYAQQIIPYPDANKSMSYDSGDKCLSIYGFTDASNLNWQNLNGNGISYVFGRKGDKKAQHAIRCLVECLHETNLVGIARGVYRTGALPKMFALMPVIDTDNFICLSMTSICYKEEIKYMAFPAIGLKKYEHTNEQVNAFKGLIKAMDLTNAYDDSYDDKEAFPIAQTVSPTVQYVLDSIAFRAMNPGKPLPKPRNDIMMLFRTPILLEKRSKESIEKLKSLFILNKVENKTKERKINPPELLANAAAQQNPSINDNNDANKVDMPKVQLTSVSKTSEVQRIGTKNPISDFEALVNKNKSLEELSLQMTTVIESLFHTNFDGTFNKALDTLKYFREQSVAADPSHYNNWFMKYKTELINRKKDNIVSVIHERNLGFIIKNENPLSTYETPDSHEESQLYENETVPDMTEISIKPDDDMFGDM